MRRRTFLAAATFASAFVAGCAGDPNGSGPDDDGSDGTTGADISDVDGDDPGDETVDQTDEDDRANGDDSDGSVDQTDEDDSDPVADDDPTDQELAAEHIADAQEALTAAVGEIEREGSGAVFGRALDVTVWRLPAVRIEDYLSVTRLSIADASAYDTADSQDETLDALADVEVVLRSLVEEFNEIGTAFETRNVVRQSIYPWSDSLESDTTELVTAVTDAATAIERVGGAFDSIESNTELVDAVSEEAIEQQLSLLQAEIEAGAVYADVVAQLISTERTFWNSFDLVAEEAFDQLDGEFETAMEQYEAISDLTNSESVTDSLISHWDDMHEYTEVMRRVANNFRRLAMWHRTENYGNANNDFETGVERLEEAAEIGPIDLSQREFADVGYDRWGHSGPELETSTDVAFDGEHSYISAEVENTSPDSVECTIYISGYSEPHESWVALGWTETELILGSGEVWEPDELWETAHELSDAEVVVSSIGWA